MGAAMRIILACILSLLMVTGYPSFAQYVVYSGVRAAGTHNHTCGSCGYTWTHRDNASYQEHFCPACGRGPWLEQSSRPATVAVRPQQVIIPQGHFVIPAQPPVMCNIPPVVVQKDLSKLYNIVRK